MTFPHPAPRLLPLLLALLALTAGAHAQISPSRTRPPAPEVRRALPVPEPSVSGLDEAGRLLAGLSSRSGAHDDLRALPAWQEHATRMDLLWRQFAYLRRDAIESWAARELGGLRSHDVLFYPFSGPDFLYADTFFPGADTYILCGLEPADPLPDLRSLAPDEFASSLGALHQSLTTSLQFSYFITKDMKVDFQRSRLRGTLPVLLVFLARTGHAIEAVQFISLDRRGALVERGQGTSPGLILRFRGHRDGRKALYYFSTNLANDGFSAQSAFGRFLQHFGPVMSFTKSASFLMHEGGFSNIRNFMLERSLAILQDDSGIPLRSFDPRRWEVRHYGRYSGVLDIFSKYYQPDLAAVHAGGAEPLGFGIGYKHQQGQSVMILALRRQPPAD